MTQTQRDQLTQLVNQLIQAPSCCAEAKEAGQNWLTAAGTAGEQAATQALMAELEEDIMPIEGSSPLSALRQGLRCLARNRPKPWRPTPERSRPPGPSTVTAPPAPSPRRFWP